MDADLYPASLHDTESMISTIWLRICWKMYINMLAHLLFGWQDETVCNRNSSNNQAEERTEWNLQETGRDQEWHSSSFILTWRHRMSGWKLASISIPSEFWRGLSYHDIKMSTGTNPVGNFTKHYHKYTRIHSKTNMKQDIQAGLHMYSEWMEAATWIFYTWRTGF